MLLKSIVDQCHVLMTGTVYRGRNDVYSLSSALVGLLAGLGRGRGALLCVVGADALRAARWLPERLPTNVKMIVTVTEGECCSCRTCTVGSLVGLLAGWGAARALLCVVGADALRAARWLPERLPTNVKMIVTVTEGECCSCRTCTVGSLVGLLAGLGRGRGALLCVVGADALRAARWLPERLPTNVKMIVTVTEGECCSCRTCTVGSLVGLLAGLGRGRGALLCVVGADALRPRCPERLPTNVKMIVTVTEGECCSCRTCTVGSLVGLLAGLGRGRGALLCVVGADALRAARWLPERLPTNVKMIVTVTEGECCSCRTCTVGSLLQDVYCRLAGGAAGGAGARRGALLCVVGADALRAARWLPERLPTNVKMIVTVTEGECCSCRTCTVGSLVGLLAGLGRGRGALLCVVGADALRAARWLPERLPTNVKMIVTVTEGECCSCRTCTVGSLVGLLAGLGRGRGALCVVGADAAGRALALQDVYCRLAGGAAGGAGARRGALLCVVGADALRAARWLPERLPTNVKMIVTVTEGECCSCRTCTVGSLVGLLAGLGRGRGALLCVVGADALRAARWLPERLPTNVKMIVTVTEGECCSCRTCTVGSLVGLLAGLGRGRGALLCVVGADALRAARWLPERLPTNVKMIVTVTEEKDEPSSSAIMAVLSSEDGPKVVRAPPVGPDEAKAVLTACAATYSKTGAASPPEAAVKAVQKCTLPLYAKILAWQISLSAETFTELSEPETTPELVICEDLEDQLAQILITTEAALGAERVKTCLSLLTASRRGLDDTEILDILAHDELFRSEETYLPWAPASLVWPQLAALLSPWLRWDARGAARWRDAALASAASDRYLADCDTQVRQTLIDYYEGKWYAENDPKMAGRLISQENKFSDEYYNTRKLDELPFQHYHIYKNDPKTFANQLYFTQLDWVHDKLAATDCCHFLEDIALVHIDPLPEHIEILKDVFETHSYALDYDHRQFYGLLRMTMEKRQRNGCQVKSKIVQDWMKEIRDPPVPTLYPENPDFYKIMEFKEKREFSMNEGFDSKMFDLIVRFDSRGKFVATVSTEREEICVWDVLKCKLVRKMVGVTHPINLVPIDEYKCVVLCRRELRVYNLDQGTFLVALKGVMNQKMPYYGLHDPKHLVALSRNRMYVNLMNIETGDCVTTFKAGEDRFLNSLLVSGDGRVLVCGDETQKPFPLLVWSLTSRKLLYDLRIPHHDFVTSKAAITYEGSYVCVVSRELDEPSPNFIVVYDLQSGTLFKKWKPGCDTVALAISSVDGCVVSGLADTRILVWDLVTGNCRLTLRGHVAAPSLLRLAKSGGVLMSTDDTCKDLSVRLWDLHTGKLIAVYTPPERITSCEVLLGGSVLALALENYKEVLCVKLHGPAVESVQNGKDSEFDDRDYGDETLEGRTFEIKGLENS
ncbi:uncharacterized protein LOC135116650 [Helicoverpa armigera]|uniref:uncharacterized protein LOC135116650 n=1 Tax=Helicoverpa armigera TaxID=29058 RepID=UPI0030839E68